jgi:hypothetical protein
MKQFKIVDFWISIGLIISFTAISVIEGFDNFLSNYFLVGYFVVGGWQVISMLVHAFNHWFTSDKSTRYFYHWITFISLITMPVGSIWILLFAAPFMAVFYTYLCYKEIYVKMQRPLGLLK